MSVVVYMAHPLGEGGFADNEKRADNIANAGEWVRFFVDTTRWVVLCPWYLYAITHGEAIHGPRRLIDQLAVLERCDLLLLTGGFISPHMSYEVKAAKRLGVPIVDLTGFGISPPSITDDSSQLILSRAQRAITRTPRRVWMPLLAQPAIESLKEARHALYVHMPTEHETAVEALDRIIEAATEIGDW